MLSFDFERIYAVSLVFCVCGVRKHRVRSSRGTQSQGTQQKKDGNSGLDTDDARDE